jgi:hypothetical protein
MQYLQMSRSLGINKQRTPVVQEPPRGPITSIASAKNIGQPQNMMSQTQQQQQQMLKQQYMQQQQQQKLRQQKQQMANQPTQPQTVNGVPSHVTVPQAIAVIVARLNSIERKILKPAAPLGEDEQQQQESIDLDLTIDQILARVQQLEDLVVLKSDFDQLNNKVSKLDSDLRDSKDMVLKMQSFIITTTDQVTKLSMQLNNMTTNTTREEADN